MSFRACEESTQITQEILHEVQDDKGGPEPKQSEQSGMARTLL